LLVNAIVPVGTAAALELGFAAAAEGLAGSRALAARDGLAAADALAVRLVIAADWDGAFTPASIEGAAETHPLNETARMIAPSETTLGRQIGVVSIEHPPDPVSSRRTTVGSKGMPRSDSFHLSVGRRGRR
jgi:hypothetical protein